MMDVSLTNEVCVVHPRSAAFDLTPSIPIQGPVTIILDSKRDESSSSKSASRSETPASSTPDATGQAE